ncbi:serine hydrolase [Rhizobium sp. L1K21]|uniref:serine hydrolase domain-containing protein n=1 Tax=Rhizobium sp. L1K21 TaxID=2954933 RepID=UPI0020922CEE|nr:serine hydrolase [Rhizobium sp. L1K21]MCO6187881.1 beta-lactamase family protein [Rhizobium sp. L1K21]
MTQDATTAEELGLMQGFPPPPDKQVTLQNGFWTPPYNRWAYQNMRRLMPSAPIRCPASPTPMNVMPDPRIEALEIHRPDGSLSDFQSFLRETYTDSLVVVSGDMIVHESYLNGMSAQTPHQMMSCTKSLAGLFALIAIEEGQMSPTDTIGSLLPDVTFRPGVGEATLGQLLDMTNSIRFDEDYADPGSHIHDYARIVGIGLGNGDAPKAKTIQEYLCTLSTEEEAKHGQRFHYQSPKTDLLNWITSRVTGKSYTQLAEELLWQPLGAEGEAYVLLDPAGTEIAAGGLNATPHDLARFAAMIASRGAWKGRQVIPANVIDLICKGGSPSAFLSGPNASPPMNDGHWSYRAQWWVRRTPGHKAITAQGIFGQWLYCDTNRQIAIVKQSSPPFATGADFDVYTINAFDEIIRALAP